MFESWRRFAVLGLVFVGLAYLLWPAPRARFVKDPLQVLDEEIETKFVTDFDQIDAFVFFKRGGSYMDVEGEFEPFDQPYIVPMLQRLADKFDLTWTAVTYPEVPDEAMSIYTEIPQGVSRKSLQDALVEEQNRAEFGGDILQQWGYRHLALDFLTPEEVAEEEAAERAGGSF